MKIGSLVRVVKEDRSLVIKTPGPKDFGFRGKIGIIVDQIQNRRIFQWWEIWFPESGIYETREDAIELVGVTSE